MPDKLYDYADHMGNSSTMGTYYCFWLFVYGFLVLIALITVFNIINSIAMSVSSRSKQYGSFRAIGLSTGQLRKMIVTKASVSTVKSRLQQGIKKLERYLADFRGGDNV